jgi:hypothetical protein
MTASRLRPSRPTEKWQHRLSSRTSTGTELASRQLIQSANTNPVESNETNSNNKSKSPMKGKTKSKLLTPVTCSYKVGLWEMIRSRKRDVSGKRYFVKVHSIWMLATAKLPKTRAVSTGRCNTGLEFTRRSLKTQGLSGALIETQSYFVEIGLRVDGQVGFLREVLS